MNIEVESMKITEQRKLEEHGCSPNMIESIFKFPFFILKYQLKLNFIS